VTKVKFPTQALKVASLSHHNW